MFACYFCINTSGTVFISDGSNVYLASLDATKAFDRVHHVKLFHKLLDLTFAGGIIKILFDWYCKTFTMVRWNDSRWLWPLHHIIW